MAHKNGENVIWILVHVNEGNHKMYTKNQQERNLQYKVTKRLS